MQVTIPSIEVPWTRAILLAIVTLTALGCGDDLNVVPVSGRLVVDGKPFPAARINTQPIAADMENPNPGPGSFGVTDQDGRFSLEVATDGQDGAVVGKHRVTIIMEEDAFSDDPTNDAYVPPSRKMPPWFTDQSIILEVPEGGTDSAELKLSLTKPPG